MILIRHVVDTFNRFDTWNTYTETDLRRKMGIGPDNAGCSIKQAGQIIDALFSGFCPADVSGPGKKLFGENIKTTGRARDPFLSIPVACGLSLTRNEKNGWEKRHTFF